MYEFDQESGSLMVPESEAGDVLESMQEEEEDSADFAEDFNFSPEESFSNEPPIQGFFGAKLGAMAALKGGAKGAAKGIAGGGGIGGALKGGAKGAVGGASEAVSGIGGRLSGLRDRAAGALDSFRDRAAANEPSFGAKKKGKSRAMSEALPAKMAKKQLAEE